MEARGERLGSFRGSRIVGAFAQKWRLGLSTPRLDALPGLTEDFRFVFDANHNVTLTAGQVTGWASRVGSDSVAPLSESTRPTILDGWRGTNSAVAGRASSSDIVKLTSGSLGTATIGDTWTMYAVLGWPPSHTAAQYAVRGTALLGRAANTNNLIGGSNASVATSCSTGQACIVRFRAAAATASANNVIRLEPHAGAPITVSGFSTGGTMWTAIEFLSLTSAGSNFQGHLAFCALKSGTVPVSDAEIMSYLRARYNIMHT